MREKQPYLNSIAYGVIVLTLITALIHLSQSLQFPEGPDRVFLLNAIGYIALLAAIYLPLPRLARYRSLFCWILIGYTALTIALWLFFGARSVTAYLDKVVEVGLILLLWTETRRFSA
ncbi:MAG: hypothetical protein DYG89_35955 [Caldilinea sp. CFX5]|nr:hypothetical protein [Caldilinea sp. CFX5]